MVDASDRRTKPRIIVGPDHGIRFEVQGRTFSNVRITNLSAEGCFATVHRAPAGLFQQGALLERLAFEHADLPHGPITAQVTFSLGDQAGHGAMPFVGLGIHFLAMDPATAEGLQAFVEAACLANGLTSTPLS